MAIQVISHPPERAVRSLPLMCGGCCCCCCCCIHTAGGIIGAMVGNAAPLPSPAQAVETTEDRKIKPELQVNAAYWRTTALLSLITLILGLGIFGIAIVLICLPMIQFLASVIVACRLGNQPAWKWRQLARITGYSFVGSLIGTILTIFLLFTFK